MTSDYPPYLARGISNQECVSEGTIHKCVFQFSKNTGRRENLLEMSITWLDDRGAEKTIKSQMKGDHMQFRYGFAVIRRLDLDNLISLDDFNKFHYERARTPDNPYHGNILVDDSVESVRIRRFNVELRNMSEFYKADDELPCVCES